MSDLGNKEVLARNLKRLMSENNIDRNKMCDDLKLKYSTVSEWLSANKYPRIDKIELMAKYFCEKLKAALRHCSAFLHKKTGTSRKACPLFLFFTFIFQLSQHVN